MFGNYLQSVRVAADEQIKFFQSAGENVIHEDPRMVELIRLLLWEADVCYLGLDIMASSSLPLDGRRRFSIFTFTNGIRAAKV